MNKKTIYILTDSGLRYGIGHYMRCLEIKNELDLRGYETKLTVNSKDKFDNEKRDLYIIDLPYDMTNYIDKFSKTGARVVTLEYLKLSKIPDANISVLDFPSNMNLIGNTLSGLKYIIIRNQIRSLIKKTDKVDDYGIIMLGGALTSELLLDVYSKIINLNTPLKIIINQNQRINGIKNKNIEILVNPENLPILMNNCSWSITSGGITMLEMIYLKKKTFVFPQTELEKKLSEIMLRNKLIESINPSLIDATKINHDGKMTNNNIFDGLGSKRIADEVDRILNAG